MKKQKARTIKKETDFNRDHHPERQPDEVFITNSDDDTTFSENGRSAYDEIGWNTKRRGAVSYNLSGKVIPNCYPGVFPVFVKQSEIMKKKPHLLKDLLPQT